MKYRMKKNPLLLLLFVIVISSCVPQKKMLYLKNPQMVTEDRSIEYLNDRDINYKLQPGDNLYIRVINTIDERGAAAINGETSMRTMSYTSEASIFLQSYTLDESGCIDLPLIGSVEVKNLTVEEAKDKLQRAMDQYVNQTTLIVKLSNFNLTVLGEVARPGMYKVYQSQINLFEAVSMAGNMTNFAKKNKVKLVRQTANGSEIVTIDMGQADILASPYYYLKPNDIIIVEPLKIKQWGFTTFPYSTVISILTMSVTLVSFFLYNK